MEPIYPFRWDVTKRSQIGRLIDELEPDEEAWLKQEASRTEWEARQTLDLDDPCWLENELRRCSAKIIAFCDNSDLCFVGRSPESIFDYLSGLLLNSSWSQRLAMLHFSMSATLREIRKQYPGAIEEFHKYLASLRLDPESLANRQRPVAFVDIVASGDTFGNLVGLLYSGCIQTGFDWSSVQRKIRIIGLTRRVETSPTTWRWQQHASWVSMLEPGSIKNIPISLGLFDYLGAAQSKVSQSYRPERWGDPRITVPTHNHETLLALRTAVRLFDEGRRRPNRLIFARELTRQPALQHAWFRGLIGELNR